MNPKTKKKFCRVVGFKNLDELQEKIGVFSYRKTKDECLDLPEKIYTTRRVEMTEEQEAIYQSMKEKSFVQISETELITAPLVLTQLIRLQQIVCGHLSDEDGNEVEFPHNRVSGLMDLLEEVNGKSLIFCNFRKDVQNVAKGILEGYDENSLGLYYGDTTQEERTRLVHRFQNDPTLKYLVCGSPAAYGITLTAAQNVIYYSNGYNLELRLQSEDRAHRIGQTKHVLYIDLVTPNTVDEKILKALRSKKNIAQEVLGDAWKEWI